MNDIRLCFIGTMGSKLYGLDNEESDTDLKGVFIPSFEDAILRNYPDSIRYRNTTSIEHESCQHSSQKVELELYSIQKFLSMVKENQTHALDMLHLKLDENFKSFGKIYFDLQYRRKEFYHKGIYQFIIFAKSIALRYRDKNLRYQALVQLQRRFKARYETMPELYFKISDIFENVEPVREQYQKKTGSVEDYIFIKMTNDNQRNYLVIDSTEFSLVEPIYYDRLFNFIQSKMNKYGGRTKENQFDGKSLAHAFRTCFQLKEILIHGDYSFPLKEEPFLKFGNQDEQLQQDHFSNLLHLANMLEHDIQRYDGFAKIDKVDRTINEYLITTYQDLLRNGAGFYDSEHGKYFCDDDHLNNWLLERYGVYRCGN